MLVSDIFSEARAVLGQCSETTIFRRLSDACRLAGNKGKFDWNIANLDICVCNGCVTLPADVATVLAVNTGGSPTLMRDQWFQYHINGSGSDGCTPCGFSDELGQYPTYRDPDGPVNLVAEVENSVDSNIALRVFGWDDNGKRIYTTGPGGLLQDGFLVPTVYGFSKPNPSAPAIARIDRITKPATNGFIRLLAVDTATGTSETKIGHYQPWETNPLYRRLRVGNQEWIRLKYRRKDIEVRGLGDWINIENREALLLLLKSVKLRLDEKYDSARIAEQEGVRLLSEESEAMRPPALSGPQIIIQNSSRGETDTLFF